MGGQNHHRVRGKCIVINPYSDIIAVNDESETELWPYIKPKCAASLWFYCLTTTDMASVITLISAGMTSSFYSHIFSGTDQ